MAPSRLSTGVPISSVRNSSQMVPPGRSNCSAMTGASKLSGRPVMTQWAAIFAITIIGNGSLTNASCSRVPSA